MEKVNVYGLYSTENGPSVIRYIGQTKYPLNQRRNAHVKESKEKTAITHLHRWIRGVYSRGFDVKAFLLKSGARWNSDEMEFIKKFRSLGFRLTNSTDGGEGFLNPCPEARLKISQALKGRSLSSETCLKMSIAHIGKARPPEIRLRISQGLRGNRNALGHVHSQETIRKMSEAAKRENLSAETRRKLSEAAKRENLSAETIRRRSEASKMALARRIVCRSKNGWFSKKEKE